MSQQPNNPPAVLICCAPIITTKDIPCLVFLSSNDDHPIQQEEMEDPYPDIPKLISIHETPPVSSFRQEDRMDPDPHISEILHIQCSWLPTKA